MDDSSSSTVEVPHYFLCPISLQIMTDPVTLSTGITYDRSNILRWLFSDHHSIDNNINSSPNSLHHDINYYCPVTNQPLVSDQQLQYLTPNHTLRRLIQAWCTSNSLDRIPTPRAPLTASTASSLLHNLTITNLRHLITLASDTETNRRTLVHAGAHRLILQSIISSKLTKQYSAVDDCLELSLNLLQVLHSMPVLDNNILSDLISALTRPLQRGTVSIRQGSILLLKSVVEQASSTLVLERLPVEFFRAVINIVREKISASATKAALHVLLSTSPCKNNRTKIVEAGAVSELIELELMGPDKRRSELTLGVLDNLCGCADGRAEVVGHGAGIAVVAKRVLRVSRAADERAVGILASVCRYSAKNVVLQEMVRVGGVNKMCFVLQGECERRVKEMVRMVLRLHSRVWNSSPCVSAYLLTSFPAA